MNKKVQVLKNEELRIQTAGVLAFHSMHNRLSEKFQEKYPSYKGCSVKENLATKESFMDWWIINYWSAGEEEMQLDKDIMIKGNKIYSRESCLIVPARINGLFPNAKKNRGKYAIGVSFDSYGQREGRKELYMAHVRINGKQKKLGREKTELEAFELYKEYKEKVIQEVAKEYMNKYPNTMPERLYNALMAYRVEITD